MKRLFALIFLIVLFVSSCVKKPSSDPEPKIEFQDFHYMKKTNGSDSGYIVLGYEDGDGDIFRDKGHAETNLIITTYHKDTTNGNFYPDTALVPGDVPNTYVKVVIASYLVVYQPGDENTTYKGKGVKGNIIVPYNQFRTSPTVKVIKHYITAVDEKGHEAKVISPEFTISP